MDKIKGKVEASEYRKFTSVDELVKHFVKKKLIMKAVSEIVGTVYYFVAF